MQTLTSIQQVTELANELNRKVSKADLNSRFDCVWATDKQGRAQTLVIDGNEYRTDNKAFYPNCEKPTPNGKSLTKARKGKTSADIIEAFEKLAAEKGVKLGLASQVIERIKAAEKAEIEARQLAQTLKEAAEIERLEAKAAQLQALIAAKKAAM